MLSHRCKYSVTCYFAWTSCDGAQTGNPMCGRTRKLRAFPSILLYFAGSLPDMHNHLTAAATDLMCCWHSSKKFKNQFLSQIITFQIHYIYKYVKYNTFPNSINVRITCDSFIFQSEHLLLHDFVCTPRVFKLREANRSNLSLKGPQQRVITSSMNLCAPVVLQRGLSREKRTALSLETSVRCGAVGCMASHNPPQLHYLGKKLLGHDVATQQGDTLIPTL